MKNCLPCRQLEVVRDLDEEKHSMLHRTGSVTVPTPASIRPRPPLLATREVSHVLAFVSTSRNSLHRPLPLVFFSAHVCWITREVKIGYFHIHCRQVALSRLGNRCCCMISSALHVSAQGFVASVFPGADESWPSFVSCWGPR